MGTSETSGGRNRVKVDFLNNWCDFQGQEVFDNGKGGKLLFNPLLFHLFII